MALDEDADDVQKQYHEVMEETELKMKENKVLEYFIQRNRPPTDALGDKLDKKKEKKSKNQPKVGLFYTVLSFEPRGG